MSAFAVSGSNTLTEIAVAPDSDGLAGASGIAISPDGKNIYATGASSDAVVAITRNTTTGVVVFRSRVTNPNHGLDGASAVVVSPDNAQVYVTGKNDNSIVQFNRNTTTGDLTYVERQEQGVNMADGLSAPVALVISPDGAFVYTAASGDGKIGRYTRNTSNGQLDFSALAASGLSGISNLAMSADGTQLYVTLGASGSGTVRIYDRNTSTGDLSLDSTLTDSSSSDTIKMRQPTAVAVTADGQHVYVTAKQDNSLTAIDAYLAAGTTCETGNLCTADTCDGSGTCVTGACQVGQACVDPSCAAGLCDNSGGPCVCKKLP